MSEVDWHEIKFLESSSNLKKLIKLSVGVTPSTKVANDIAVCIAQGRMFYEAALSSPLEIQPLQIFYGVAGFARAIVLARKLASLDTLSQSHGLSDVSEQNAKVEQLKIKVGGKGAFQDFNNALAPLGRLFYYHGTMPTSIPKPFHSVARMSGKSLTVTEVLSRVLKLQSLYERTFDEPAKVLHIDLHHWPEYDEYVTLRLDDRELFTDRESLANLVKKWRERYPFLEGWCFSNASLAWGNSILNFSNIDKKGFDEFSEEFLVQDNGAFNTKNLGHNRSLRRIKFQNILPPIAGGITKSHEYVIQPFCGLNLSEFSYHYLGCYLLSSLVRYRPQVWQHAISRSFSENLPADDRSLALIQRFLELVVQDFPKLVVSTIDYTSGDVSEQG